MPHLDLGLGVILTVPMNGSRVLKFGALAIVFIGDIGSDSTPG